MIKVNPRHLRASDIGLEFTVNGYTGVVANYTNFKNHVEVVFEDGTRKELNEKDILTFADSTTLNVTSEELRVFIKHHPLKKKYEDDVEQWTHRASFSLRRETEPHPEYPDKLTKLEKLLNSIER